MVFIAHVCIREGQQHGENGIRCNIQLHTDIPVTVYVRALAMTVVKEGVGESESGCLNIFIIPKDDHDMDNL
jgi:hypothetical protein